jgi:cytoskeletal protein RodZ
VGKFLTEARKSGGFTPEQVAAETHIPSHYIKAIETDDYGMISDQLYLLPFLRRYAAFLGLDPEDIASRFVRDVQRAESTSSRGSEPIPIISSDERKPGFGGYLVAILVVLAIAALVVFAVIKRQVLLERVLRLSPSSSSTGEQNSSTPSAASRATDSSASVPFESSVTPAPAAEPSPAARAAGDISN